MPSIDQLITKKTKGFEIPAKVYSHLKRTNGFPLYVLPHIEHTKRGKAMLMMPETKSYSTEIVYSDSRLTALVTGMADWRTDWDPRGFGWTTNMVSLRIKWQFLALDGTAWRPRAHFIEWGDPLITVSSKIHIWRAWAGQRRLGLPVSPPPYITVDHKEPLTAYKIVGVSPFGGKPMFSLYEPSFRYIVGATMIEPALPDHGGGFYAYEDKSGMLLSWSRGQLIDTSHCRNVYEVAILKVKMWGTVIPYDGGKLAASHIQPTEIVKVMPNVHWVDHVMDRF